MCVLEGGGVRTLKLSINLLSNLEFLSAIMGGGGELGTKERLQNTKGLPFK